MLSVTVTNLYDKLLQGTGEGNGLVSKTLPRKGEDPSFVLQHSCKAGYSSTCL